MPTSTRTPTSAAAAVVREPWGRRPWVLPLAVVTVGFLAFSLPPYLSLDPSRARIQPLPAQSWYYPLLVTHIFLGSVVLLTGCLQIWPWLRRQHPVVHRWSGRAYVAACLPAAVCVIAIAPLGGQGPNQQVANSVLGILWLITTLAGYRAVRARRFGAHREWMTRSFALSFSIVANRLWLVAMLALFAPEVLTTGVVDPAVMAQAVGVAAWLSWVVNLLVAEWWLHRRSPVRARVAAGGPSRLTGLSDAGATPTG
jgi:uncharacterized membrane protein